MSDSRIAVMYGGPMDGHREELEFEQIDGDTSRWSHKEPNGWYSVYVRREPIEKILAQHRANSVCFDYVATVERLTDIKGVRTHGDEEVRDRPDPA